MPLAPDADHLGILAVFCDICQMNAWFPKSPLHLFSQSLMIRLIAVTRHALSERIAGSAVVLI